MNKCIKKIGGQANFFNLIKVKYLKSFKNIKIVKKSK